MITKCSEEKKQETHLYRKSMSVVFKFWRIFFSRSFLVRHFFYSDTSNVSVSLSAYSGCEMRDLMKPSDTDSTLTKAYICLPKSVCNEIELQLTYIVIYIFVSNKSKEKKHIFLLSRDETKKTDSTDNNQSNKDTDDMWNAMPQQRSRFA